MFLKRMLMLFFFWTAPTCTQGGRGAHSSPRRSIQMNHTLSDINTRSLARTGKVFERANERIARPSKSLARSHKRKDAAPPSPRRSIQMNHSLR